jgi:hypothetical protein
MVLGGETNVETLAREVVDAATNSGASGVTLERESKRFIREEHLGGETQALNSNGQ